MQPCRSRNSYTKQHTRCSESAISIAEKRQQKQTTAEKTARSKHIILRSKNEVPFTDDIYEASHSHNIFFFDV